MSGDGILLYVSDGSGFAMRASYVLGFATTLPMAGVGAPEKAEDDMPA